MPANGTFGRRVETGAIYRVAGGAPLYLNDCSQLNACSGTIDVNGGTIDNLDHLNAVPADGTFVRRTDSGGIYRVAGGAPLYVNDCSQLNACAGTVDVSGFTIDSLDHLRSTPANGTFIRKIETGAIYRVAGGAPLYIADCTPLNGCAGTVDVDSSTIDNHDHMNVNPTPGTVLHGLPTDTFWSINAPYRHQVAAPQPAAVDVDDSTLQQFTPQ